MSVALELVKTTNSEAGGENDEEVWFMTECEARDGVFGDKFGAGECGSDNTDRLDEGDGDTAHDDASGNREGDWNNLGHLE